MTQSTDPVESDPASTPKRAAPTAGLDSPILALLKKDRRAHTPEELAEQSGMPLTGVKRALGKLVHDRLARKAGGGKFAAAARPGRR